MPTNILNLPDYRVLGIEETADDYHISADLTHAPRTCPVCRSAALRGHGRNEQVIRDLPIHGKLAQRKRNRFVDMVRRTYANLSLPSIAIAIPLGLACGVGTGVSPSIEVWQPNYYGGMS